MVGLSQTQLEELSRLGCEDVPENPHVAEQIVARRRLYVRHPASDRQKARLRFLGYTGDTKYLLKGTASVLLDGLIKRKNEAEWETWKKDRMSRGLRDVPYSWELNQVFSAVEQLDRKSTRRRVLLQPVQPSQLFYLAQLEYSGEPENFDHAEWLINDLRSMLPPDELSLSEYLRLLGQVPPVGDDEFFWNLLLSRVLRPVNNAISIVFAGSIENWPPRALHALQAAVAKWPGCNQLPLYGPHISWDEINAAGPTKRALGPELEAAILEIAHVNLPQEFFRRLRLRAKRMQIVKDRLEGA